MLLVLGEFLCRSPRRSIQQLGGPGSVAEIQSGAQRPSIGMPFDAADMYDDGQLKFHRLAVNVDR